MTAPLLRIEDLHVWFDLEGGREEGRVHESIADIGNRHEFDRDHKDGKNGRQPEVVDQVG